MYFFTFFSTGLTDHTIGDCHENMNSYKEVLDHKSLGYVTSTSVASKAGNRGPSESNDQDSSGVSAIIAGMGQAGIKEHT